MHRISTWACLSLWIAIACLCHADDGDATLRIRKATLKIKTTYIRPSYYTPWRMQTHKSMTGSGAIISDNRIAALASDTSVYTFALPPAGTAVTVDVELVFRRLYQDLMEAKDWDTPDILMEQAQVQLETARWRWEILIVFPWGGA